MSSSVINNNIVFQEDGGTGGAKRENSTDRKDGKKAKDSNYNTEKKLKGESSVDSYHKGKISIKRRHDDDIHIPDVQVDFNIQKKKQQDHKRAKSINITQEALDIGKVPPEYVA